MDKWQPIETAPKGQLIDVWVQQSQSPGYRLADVYHDSICSEWRTSRPSGQLVCVMDRYVSHWMPRPAPPEESENG